MKGHDIGFDLERQAPESDELLGEITRSLLSTPPFLPAKLHYDERGSELFEEICQ